MSKGDVAETMGGAPNSDTLAANRTPQRFPVEAVRAAASAVASPANAAGKPVIAQPTVDEAPGVVNSQGAIAHILSAGPMSSAPPSLNNGPANVSAAFTRMDSAAPPQLLESVPQRLSVGVRDSGLGWVEVRTHASAGQVSAVLATGSSEAHAALQAQLPALRDYLAGQQVRVDQLASERFSSPGGGREPASQQDGRNGPSRDSGAPIDRPQMPAVFSEGAEESLSYINVRV